MLPEEFRQLLAAKGIELTDQQMTQFDQYFHLLVEWNENEFNSHYRRKRSLFETFL